MGAPEIVHQGERTALYRFYDADDRLLYIGIARDPDSREEMHRYWSHWHVNAVRRTDHWMPTRQQALAAEKSAIRLESPLHNKAHNFDLAPHTHTNWPSLRQAKRRKAALLAGLIESEISSGRWLPGQCIPSPESLALAVDVSPGTALAARRLLVQRHVLRRVRGSGHFVASPD